MNAFTDREQTVFYIKVLSSHLDQALGIYADMLLRSTLARIAPHAVVPMAFALPLYRSIRRGRLA